MKKANSIEILIEKIEGRITDLKKDDRSVESGNRLATVFENAPLALIQLGITKEIEVLRSVIVELKKM